jgi:hypothetical protein
MLGVATELVIGFKVTCGNEAGGNKKPSASLALQLLALHCMNLTLDEVKEQQDRLRQEIMERQCLLAAFDVMHRFMAQGGNVAKSAELGPLISAFASSTPSAAKSVPSPAALPTLPAPAPVQRYIHPELVAMGRHGGTHVQYVRWALERITEDFTLHDIAALLEREGYALKNSEISVVLTRMKARGAIEEIRCGHGPKPALFRQPNAADPSGTPAVDSPPQSEVSTATAAVA